MMVDIFYLGTLPDSVLPSFLLVSFSTPLFAALGQPPCEVLYNPFRPGWSSSAWEGEDMINSDDFSCYQQNNQGCKSAEWILRKRTKQIYRELFKEQ